MKLWLDCTRSPPTGSWHTSMPPLLQQMVIDSGHKEGIAPGWSPFICPTEPKYFVDALTTPVLFCSSQLTVERRKLPRRRVLPSKQSLRFSG
jgi:hypothetical protein